MADNFDVLGSRATEEVQPDGTTIDVQQVDCKATPSGVVFGVRVPLATFSDGAVLAAASPLADTFNEVATLPAVTSVSMVQDVTPLGGIEDRVQATIVSTSGKSSSIVDMPLSEVQRGRLPEAVGALQGELDEVEVL